MITELQAGVIITFLVSLSYLKEIIICNKILLIEVPEILKLKLKLTLAATAVKLSLKVVI